ncbi:MAG: sarcosine oxidase subunit delta [Sphingomonadales bacterium]
MRIPCPYCGDRDANEFTFRGSAEAIAPEPERFYTTPDQLYLRDNPAGLLRELWYHGAGCRNWLLVTRDTRTHAIRDSELARGAEI